MQVRKMLPAALVCALIGAAGAAPQPKTREAIKKPAVQAKAPARGATLAQHHKPKAAPKEAVRKAPVR